MDQLTEQHSTLLATITDIISKDTWKLPSTFFRILDGNRKLHWVFPERYAEEDDILYALGGIMKTMDVICYSDIRKFELGNIVPKTLPSHMREIIGPAFILQIITTNRDTYTAAVSHLLCTTDRIIESPTPPFFDKRLIGLYYNIANDVKVSPNGILRIEDYNKSYKLDAKFNIPAGYINNNVIN